MTEPRDSTVRSVYRRLTQRSLDRREDFQITLVRYGVERFLYRLSRTPQVDNYVVKGSTLFTVWLDQAYRPTRDLDLAGTEGTNPSEIGWLKEVMLQAFPEDGLIFDTNSLKVKPIRHMHQHAGVSASFIARLGKTRIHLTVDIGFSDVISPPPEMADFPTLLDLPQPRVRLYPREAFVAEKFEAIVRWGRKNSRLKDFADIVFVSENLELTRFGGHFILKVEEKGVHDGKESRCVRPGVPEADGGVGARWTHAGRAVSGV